MDRDLSPASASLKELIEAAASHYAGGRLVDAENSYRQLIAIVPDWADAYNNLGCVLSHLGDDLQAEASYRKAIELDAGHTRAHFNLAYGLQKAGTLDRAAASYRQAIALDPQYAQAHACLGLILLSLGQLQVAEAHLRQAVSIEPGNPEARNALGNVLKARGNFAEAADCYRCAINLRPNAFEFQNNLGLVLEDQGNLREAIDAYRQAISLNPQYAQAGYNLSQIKVFKDRDADFESLQRTVEQSGSLPLDSRPYAHFALAKAYDDLRDYSNAFEQLDRGNRQKRNLITYDEDENSVRFQQIKEAFSAQRMRANRSNGHPSEVPIFIVGMARSGSTLVEQILSTHPQIQAAGELPLLDRIVTGVRTADGESLHYPLAFPAEFQKGDGPIQQMATTYLTGLPALHAGKSRITDKMPGNFLHLGLIHHILPHAKIIHTLRNPADTCFSCFSKLFWSGMAFTYDLAELGRYYRNYEMLMDHWRSVLPPEVMLEVSYESLIDDLDGQARRMIDHCGVPWDAKCIDYQSNLRLINTASKHQVRRPLYRDSIHCWQRYQPHLQPLLDELTKIQVRCD